MTGIPQTVPLAEGYLDEEEFQDLPGGPNHAGLSAGRLDHPLVPWETSSSRRTSAFFGAGSSPTPSGTCPGFRYQLGGGLLVRLGTGDQEDPARFFDQDIGDGQLDFEGTVFGLVELGSRLGAWGQLRYGIQTEGDIYRRITDPSQSLPNYRRTAPLKWTPGNYLEVDLNPRVFLTPAMSFGVRYHLWSKGADSYTLGAVNPDIQDPADLPPADLLNLETEQKLQEIGFSATFSTVEAHARGEASMPLYVRATYFHPVAGSGGQTPKGGRFQAGLTIYKTFWGRRDSDQAPRNASGPLRDLDRNPSPSSSRACSLEVMDSASPPSIRATSLTRSSPVSSRTRVEAKPATSAFSTRSCWWALEASWGR